MKSWLHHRVVRHVLFWAAVAGFFWLVQLPAQLLGAPNFYHLSQYLFIMLPGFLLATYPLLYGVLPGLLGGHHRRLFLGALLGWALGSALLASLLRAFFTFVVGPGLYREMPKQPFSWLAFRNEGLDFSFFALLVVALGAGAIKVMNGWYEQQQISQALLGRRLQTELQLLKAQLQPAFLFDTLRTLHALTLAKAAESPGAVLRLAALLRYLLYDSVAHAVPLADEVAMLRHYVALEQLRLGHRVDVSLTISGRLDGPTIAPLLLLPFVENAFRPGPGAPLDGAWVSIDLVARRDGLTFKVINGRADDAPAPPEGSGLGRVRQRLAHLYPGQHELKILTEPDTFQVSLKLRLAPDEQLVAAGSSPVELART